MPVQLIKRIQVMRHCAAARLVCVILLIISFGFLIQSIFDSSIRSSVILVFGIIALLCGLVLLSLHCYLKKNSGTFSPYRIPILPHNLDAATAMLYTQKVGDDAYGFVGNCGKIKVRLLALYQSRFAEDQLALRRKKANAVLNKTHCIPREESLFEAISRLRINVVICQEETEELNKWVSKRTSQMLLRNESIVSAAILLNSQELLFPAFLSGDVELKEINKYEAAARILVERLR